MFDKTLDEKTKQAVRCLAKIAKKNNFEFRCKEKKMIALLYDYFKGKCFWCGVETVREWGDGVQARSDMATVDHTISRYFRRKHQEVPKVLACHQCNRERGLIELKLYGKRKQY